MDTSVWSQAFRRDAPSFAAEVRALSQAIEGGELVFATGLILQELLQGFSGPRDSNLIAERFSAVPLLSPDREDHIRAAELRNRCRRAGVQIATIDALLAQLCLRHDLTMLTADDDFQHIAGHCSLRLWNRTV